MFILLFLFLRLPIFSNLFHFNLCCVLEFRFICFLFFFYFYTELYQLSFYIFNTFCFAVFLFSFYIPLSSFLVDSLFINYRILRNLFLYNSIDINDNKLSHEKNFYSSKSFFNQFISSINFGSVFVVSYIN